MVQKAKAGLAAALLLTTLCACASNDPKEVEEKGKPPVPTEVSTGVTAYYSDSGEVKAKLTASKMIRTLTEDPIIEMRDGLQVTFFAPDKSVESTLTADYGVRFLNTGITRVNKHVVVVNNKGDSLNTEELNWDERQNEIYTRKFVKVRTRSEIILADGFKSDVGFTDYTFYNIKGRIPLNE